MYEFNTLVINKYITPVHHTKIAFLQNYTCKLQDIVKVGLLLHCIIGVYRPTLSLSSVHILIKYLSSTVELNIAEMAMYVPFTLPVGLCSFEVN